MAVTAIILPITQAIIIIRILRMMGGGTDPAKSPREGEFSRCSFPLAVMATTPTTKKFRMERETGFLQRKKSKIFLFQITAYP